MNKRLKKKKMKQEALLRTPAEELAPRHKRKKEHLENSPYYSRHGYPTAAPKLPKAARVASPGYVKKEGPITRTRSKMTAAERQASSRASSKKAYNANIDTERARKRSAYTPTGRAAVDTFESGEKYRARQRKYYDKNKEEINAARREQYEKVNPKKEKQTEEEKKAKARERSKKYYEDHKEEIKAKNKAKRDALRDVPKEFLDGPKDKKSTRNRSPRLTDEERKKNRQETQRKYYEKHKEELKAKAHEKTKTGQRRIKLKRVLEGLGFNKFVVNGVDDLENKEINRFWKTVAEVQKVKEYLIPSKIVFETIVDFIDDYGTNFNTDDVITEAQRRFDESIKELEEKEEEDAKNDEIGYGEYF